MKQPCHDCGKPADAFRCSTCGAAFSRGRDRAATLRRKQKGGRPQYGGSWAAYSRAVRATATVCWICGDGPRPDDPWQADHVLPAAKYGGDGPARAAHRSCNIGRANRLRATNNQPTTAAYGDRTPPSSL